MKRLHIHVSVDDLSQSIRFYSALFGCEPAKQKRDYAKWMLDDPKVNFAISARGAKAGIDHLGIQVEEGGELEEVRERLKKADLHTFAEGETTCCYAKSDKTWVKDPSGIAWEAYQTMAEAAFFNEAGLNATACCAPEMASIETPVNSGCC
ncbi:Glyoxalase/bleomycin resistance protein/dioxygenase [Nitrosococcus halophilus Nc 4]|uniref:Glyoxalase/bleomycin resistance protein/dioxygenase n=1 Tax=Nitrosococcus halophilus (strain Nc4) TaxID=472759 RepID=D5C0S5_NITHN|nr:ArsI/CadI family heavy metal resistance metalloenzyme [Nitrosococcus halophilus]ADE16398.1 Glyoxalase/bleomycin resistance protein/dioxygenase [Nitrosococcus halophilus Nc 4]